MTTNTDQTNLHVDPTQGTPAGENIDWEKRYKDLQSFHDKSKDGMVSKEEFTSLQTELQSLQGTAHVNTQKEILGSLHPDYGSVIQSEQFGSWIQSQPTAMQDAIYHEAKLDGALAGSTLTLFKTQMGAQQAQAVPDTSAEAAMAVSGGHRETPQVNTKPVFTYAQIDNMTPDEYTANRDLIKDALQDGRVQ